MSVLRKPAAMLPRPRAFFDCRARQQRIEWLYRLLPRIRIVQWAIDNRLEPDRCELDNDWVPPFLRAEPKSQIPRNSQCLTAELL